MKTTYYLVTGTALAVAALVVYAQLPNLNGPLPPVANTALAAPSDVPRIPLPPVSTPPDEPLVMPGATPNELPPLPVASGMSPAVPGATPSATPVGHSEPAVPTVPALPPSTAPALPPVTAPEVSLPPVTPVAPVVPAPGAEPLPAPPVPVLNPPAATEPPMKPNAPVEPLVPPPALTPPPAPQLLPPAKPVPTPTPVLQPPVQPTPSATMPSVTSTTTPSTGEQLPGMRYVVLKEDKIIEGLVTFRGDVVVVRQGALDRSFAKGQVQYVAESKDEVYRFQLAKVPATDVASRLKIARWCMFSGLREQALTEAREVQKLQPTNTDAASLVRSLELSLKQYPPADAPKMTAPAAPTFPAVEPSTVAPAVPAELSNRPAPPVVSDPDPEIAPEAVKLFATKVQPILANQCVTCHAKSDYAGAFKLVSVAPETATAKQTRANLWAVVGQLRKDDPAASPLLVKSLQAHGGQKTASFASRRAAAYITLEAWAALAIGNPMPPATPVVPVPAAPATVTPVPTMPVMPPVAVPAVEPPAPVLPPVANPALPPEAVVPVIPVVPAPVPATPAPVPAVPTPVVPPAPVLPPVVEPALPPLPASPPSVPAVPPAPVLPAPPMLPAADPVLPPAPSAPTLPKLPAPAAPGIPPIPPPSGFGETLPPKPPMTGPTVDEFDPAGFNQVPPKK